MNNININDLISKVNIVDVIGNFSKLYKSGSSLKTLCNIHGDKSPSLSINIKKQIYKCFVCDHGGNALDYLLWAQKMNFNDAIEFLIKMSGENIENYQSLISKKKVSKNEINLRKAIEDSSDIFNYYLNIYLDEKNNEITKFIEKRKLTKDIINKFKLGFSPISLGENGYIEILEKKGNAKSTLINASILNENGTHIFFKNRLIFPIFDENDSVVGFSGRRITDEKNDDSPKYLNSRESLLFKKSEILYNYNRAKSYNEIIIVEGFMDVIAFSKIGKNNTVSLMGLSISNTIINKFKRHQEILLFLDNDEAGKKASLKLIQVFILNNINATVLINDEGKDADEIVNEENGKSKLEKILENKVHLIDFVFDVFTSNLEKNNFEKIKNMIINIYKYSKDFDQLTKLDIINRISVKFDISKDTIFEYFQNKPNVIELNQLDNANITTKNTLEFELNQPININKILISIWKNPSFLKSLNIVNINWPSIEYKRIYEEIKNYHENKSLLSSKSSNFIKEKESTFKSKESLPKDIRSFDELITRSKKDFKKSKLKDIDNLIKSTENEEQQEEFLKMKLKIKSRKD